MPVSTTKIHVTATDNECYILAARTAAPWYSSEICHLKSGYNKPVDYTVVPQSILAPGDYNLILVGINWGGPQALSVTLTDSSNQSATHSAPAGSTVGVFWSKAVLITV
jgi:hypothetical protein